MILQGGAGDELPAQEGARAHPGAPAQEEVPPPRPGHLKIYKTIHARKNYVSESICK